MIVKDLNFKFNLMLINLNLNSHMWLLDTIPGSTDMSSYSSSAVTLETMCLEGTDKIQM